MKRYNTYNDYTQRKYGTKVIKIPLDGGFTCPNIDGIKGVGGCTYCTKECLPYRGKPIREQFALARAPLLAKWGREGRQEKYIPYFQVFTNTYAPSGRLRALYEEALALPDTVGLDIATRADCLSDNTVALLHEIASRTDLTVELGLQTVHEETARRIRRGHSFEEFLRGYEKLRGIPVCIHLINGLPGETREMMLATAKTVAALRPAGIKLHNLYIEKGTAMAEEYAREPFPMLSLAEYCEIVVSQLEYFSPDTVIGRVTGDGKRENLIAPLWSLKKFNVLNSIDREFEKRDTRQGRLYAGEPSCLFTNC